MPLLFHTFSSFAKQVFHASAASTIAAPILFPICCRSGRSGSSSGRGRGGRSRDSCKFRFWDSCKFRFRSCDQVQLSSLGFCSRRVCTVCTGDGERGSRTRCTRVLDLRLRRGVVKCSSPLCSSTIAIASAIDSIAVALSLHTAASILTLTLTRWHISVCLISLGSGAGQGAEGAAAGFFRFPP